MITFKEYLNWLTEARIDDAKAKYPQHVDAIDTLNSIDPDPQKKHLPWLVKQHVEGKLELPQTDADKAHMSKIISAIGNPTNRKVHGITNYQSMNWGDVKSKVEPSLNVKSKKEQKAADTESGISKIYEGKTPTGNKVEAFDLKTKSAAQNVYGGGRQLGGNKTSWCIAAKGDSNMFGFHYGKPYTIHVEGDPKSPYAYHPDHRNGVITTGDNDGDKDKSDVLSEKPELKPAVDAIDIKHEKFIREIQDVDGKLDSNTASHNDIQFALRPYIPEHIREKAFNQPNRTREHLKEIVDNINPKSEIDKKASLEYFKPQVDAVLNGSSDKKDLMGAIRSGNSEAGVKALEHPNADSSHFKQASFSWDDKIRDSGTKQFQKMLSEGNEHRVTSKDLHNALDGLDEESAKLAINHPNATSEHYKKGVDSPFRSVSDVATDRYYKPLRDKLKTDSATTKDIDEALKSNHKDTVVAGLSNPKATNVHFEQAMSNSNWDISDAAKDLYTKPLRDNLENRGNSDDIYAALKSNHYKTMMAGLAHPNIKQEHLKYAYADPFLYSYAKPAYESLLKNKLDTPNSDMTSDEIGDALKSGNHSLMMSALNHKDLQEHHVDKILSNPSSSADIKYFAKIKKDGFTAAKAGSSEASDSDIISGLQSFGEPFDAALNHKNLKTDHILKALKTATGYQKQQLQDKFSSMLESPNVTGKDLTNALKTSGYKVALKALRVGGKKLTKSHIQLALKHPDDYVRYAAQDMAN